MVQGLWKLCCCAQREDHYYNFICLLIASNREWLANRHLEGFDKESFMESIQVTENTDGHLFI